MKNVRLSLLALALALVCSPIFAQQNGNGHAPSQSERQELFAMIDACGKIISDCGQLGGKLQSLYELSTPNGNGNNNGNGNGNNSGQQNQINARIYDTQFIMGEVNASITRLQSANITNRLIINAVQSLGVEAGSISRTFDSWVFTPNGPPGVILALRDRVGNLAVLSGTIRHMIQDSFAPGH